MSDKFVVAVWLELDEGPQWVHIGPFESREEAAEYASHYPSEDVAVAPLLREGGKEERP